MKRFIIAALAALSFSAHATVCVPGSFTVTWINPTTRINGAPLPRAELRGIRFYVDGVYIASASGATLDAQSIRLTIKCYRPGRLLTATGVDTKGHAGPFSSPVPLP